MKRFKETATGKVFKNGTSSIIVLDTNKISVNIPDYEEDYPASSYEETIYLWGKMVNILFPDESSWVNEKDEKDTLLNYLEEIEDSPKEESTHMKYTDEKEEEDLMDSQNRSHSFEIEDLGKGVHRTTYDNIHVTNEEGTKQLKRIADKLTANNSTEEIVDKTESGDYTIDDFHKEVLGKWDYEKHFKYSLLYKGALLLVSPPGMGKTTIAKALAKLVVKYRESYRIKIISFSESTDRNNMIDGIKCINGVWQYAKGELMKFFELAAQEPEKPFILVIDEINRGKTERIFGEIMTCMEDRGKHVTTMYGRELIIPQNVIFIGTMNSYDQSVVSLSAAVKDRFDTLDFQYYEECKVSSEEIIELYELEESSAQAQALVNIMKLVDNINSLLERDLRKGKDNIIGNRIYFTNKYDYKGNKIEIDTGWFTRLAREIKIKSLDKASWLSENEQDEIKEYIDNIENIVDKLEVQS